MVLFTQVQRLEFSHVSLLRFVKKLARKSPLSTSWDSLWLTWISNSFHGHATERSSRVVYEDAQYLSEPFSSTHAQKKKRVARWPPKEGDKRSYKATSRTSPWMPHTHARSCCATCGHRGSCDITPRTIVPNHFLQTWKVPEVTDNESVFTTGGVRTTVIRLKECI